MTPVRWWTVIIPVLVAASLGTARAEDEKAECHESTTPGCCTGKARWCPGSCAQKEDGTAGYFPSHTSGCSHDPHGSCCSDAGNHGDSCCPPCCTAKKEDAGCKCSGGKCSCSCCHTQGVEKQIAEALESIRDLLEETAPAPSPATVLMMPPFGPMSCPMPFGANMPYGTPPMPGNAPVDPATFVSRPEPIQAPHLCIPGSLTSELCRPPVVPWHPAETTSKASSAWVLRVIEEEGEARLEVRTGDTSATCENLLLKMPGGNQLKLLARDRQVQICGACLQAAADSLTRTGADDRVILQGHVRLKYHKGTQSAEVAADRVVVGLAEGHLEVMPGTAPESPTAEREEHQKMYTFWQGFFR